MLCWCVLSLLYTHLIRPQRFIGVGCCLDNTVRACAFGDLEPVAHYNVVNVNVKHPKLANSPTQPKAVHVYLQIHTHIDIIKHRHRPPHTVVIATRRLFRQFRTRSPLNSTIAERLHFAVDFLCILILFFTLYMVDWMKAKQPVF